MIILCSDILPPLEYSLQDYTLCVGIMLMINACISGDSPCTLRQSEVIMITAHGLGSLNLAW